MISGQIFDIQRFSINDGPGIRTTVFLKGCNMRCFWCHNPESHLSHPQIQFFSSKCIGCGKCVEVSPGFAEQTEEGGKIHVIDRSLANDKCVEVCNAEALVLTGKTMSTEDIMKEVVKDAPFYNISGGGVTFSGGEPLLQKEFLKDMLAICKTEGFHTAVDTAGNVAWDIFEEIIPYTDLFLYDVKCMDEEKHKAATGLDNRKIIRNIKRLASSGTDIWVRIPVIPGINDSKDEMIKIADLIEDLNGVRLVEFFPFHKFGKEKYEGLGMEYKADSLLTVPEEQLLEFENIFKERQIVVKRA